MDRTSVRRTMFVIEKNLRNLVRKIFYTSYNEQKQIEFTTEANEILKDIEYSIDYGMFDVLTRQCRIDVLVKLTSAIDFIPIKFTVTYFPDEYCIESIQT